MRTYLYLFLVVLSVGLFSGCKSTAKITATLADLNGEWNVVELNGKNLNPEETKQFLGIETSTERLFGNAGCNRIMGKVEYNAAQKNIIRFLNVASTRMACPDMSGETELLKALSDVARFEVEGDSKPIKKIVLYGMNGSKVMVLEKK